MSVLFVENVRFGERQLTVFSVVMSIAGMSIAWAVPTRRLSRERPFPGQFNAYLVVSVLAQIAIHFSFLYLTHSLVYNSGFKIDKFNFRARFDPTLLNTAMFLLKSEMELVTICCNYRGNPFMQSFSENKTLLVGVIAAALVIIILLADVHPKIGELLQLAPYPSKRFQFTLALYCALDAGLCVLFERVILEFFSRKNRRSAVGLVSPEIVESLESYMSIDDDVLPESAHSFGIMDMLKENVMMQKTIKDKQTTNALLERQKQELARKAREEAEDYISHAHNKN
jgi:cation-transporting ATPase 13A1